MKQRMIKIVKISGIFLAGIIIGGTLMNLLHMYVRPVYRETVRIDLKTEQEFLASRAARQHDNFRAASHRWNVVDAEAKDGFRAFQKERNKDIDSSFFFPFYMVALAAMVHPKEGVDEKAIRISEGIARGHLALALESIGNREEADKQWEIARTLTNNKSIEGIRNFILKLREQEKTDTYLQTEKEILGYDTDKAQQKSRSHSE